MVVGTKARTARKKRPAKKKAPVLKRGFVVCDIARMVKAPWNYKLDDDAKYTKLLANIKRNGQMENIIIRQLGGGTYEVVNGNHRYDAFHEAGVRTPMCFNVGKVSLAAAERIAVETNETKFDNDPIKLSEVLTTITKEFSRKELLVTMPFEPDEFDSYANLMDFEDDFDKKKKNADQDYDNDFTGDDAVDIPVGRLFQSLSISSCNPAEAELISEAILRERMDMKLPIAQKENTPALMGIIRKYLERSTAAVTKKGKKSAPRKRTTRKRS